MKPAYLRLEALLGADNVLLQSEKLEVYATDESGLGRFLPECAVLCDTTEQVAAVLRIAEEENIPVTPRGAGSGMTGGALPVAGGIVLSTERMQAIKEIDEESLLAVVEPGLITGEFQTTVEEQGLFYPPDPASLGFCSIGGNVAECAGGPRAFRYGVTREYVLGLEVVRMGGAALRTGKRTVKGVTGYDVTALFVGSEGTLGVVTEVTLRLLPLPQAAQAFLAIFPDAPTAGRAITAMLRVGTQPRALELLDKATLAHLEGKGSYRFPANAGAVVFCELDGVAESLETAVLRSAEAMEAAGAVDVLIAKDERERKAMWETRRLASSSLRHAHVKKVSEDVVVPRRHIGELLSRVDRISGDTNIESATFGHAGDGNLHVNFLMDEPLTTPGMADRLDEALGRLFRETLALGGTLSGEHGIGLAKKRYLPWEQSAELISLQKELKRVLDPKGLLNPGKIFP